MNLTKQIANQFREVYLNGTWVATNLKTQLSDVSWEEANTKIGSVNTLAMLAFHVNYYVAGVLNVLEGGTLDIRDKYSYDMSPIASKEDWDTLLAKIWKDGERFAELLEQMNDDQLWKPFVDEKYGNYYRNMLVMVEHSYYHLGQIVLIKKLIREGIANKP